MTANEMHIVVWALALLLPILPALLFFWLIPGSATAEAWSDDSDNKVKSSDGDTDKAPTKKPFWGKFYDAFRGLKFKLSGAAAAYLVFAVLALYYRPVYVWSDEVFTVYGWLDVDQGQQRPQIGELIFGTLPPPIYSELDGSFTLNVIAKPDAAGAPRLFVNWKDQKVIGNPGPVHLDPADPSFDKKTTEIKGHTITIKKHFTMKAPPAAPTYAPSPSEAQ